MRKKITLRYLRSIRACYNDEELEQLWDNAGLGKSCTPIEFAKCSHPKKDDLLWVLLREDFIPEKQLHLLACDFAEEALLAERVAGREPDLRSWKAIEVKRLWAQGQASTDARAAASAAASAAAWAAAWAAARAAARAAASAAARAAASAAASAAAWAAASDAQLAMVIELMERGEG